LYEDGTIAVTAIGLDDQVADAPYGRNCQDKQEKHQIHEAKTATIGHAISGKMTVMVQAMIGWLRKSGKSRQARDGYEHVTGSPRSYSFTMRQRERRIILVVSA
jgi:hypothetical protein